MIAIINGLLYRDIMWEIIANYSGNIAKSERTVYTLGNILERNINTFEKSIKMRSPKPNTNKPLSSMYD